MALRVKDQKAIAELGEMFGEDVEREHSRADELLLSLVHPEVAEAFRDADDRVGFWYA